MASYGSFIADCGFTCHGPQGHIGFAPRLAPDDFRAAFTSSEGWGTFAQKRAGKTLNARLFVRHGRLKLNTLALAARCAKVTAKYNGRTIAASVAAREEQAFVTFTPGLDLVAGQELTLTLA